MKRATSQEATDLRSPVAWEAVIPQRLVGTRDGLLVRVVIVGRGDGYVAGDEERLSHFRKGRRQR